MYLSDVKLRADIDGKGSHLYLIAPIKNLRCLSVIVKKTDYTLYSPYRPTKIIILHLCILVDHFVQASTLLIIMNFISDYITLSLLTKS